MIQPFADNLNGEKKKLLKQESNSSLPKVGWLDQQDPARQSLRSRPYLSKSRSQSLKKLSTIESLTNSRVVPRTQPWATTICNVLEHQAIQYFFLFLTIVALFANDFTLAFLPRTYDLSTFVILIIVVVMFSIEIVLTCIAKENYINSFFFW
eukprot:TRINITY_DN9335_c0_g3_i1.p1 TRINITY_DN9335_c0_g3~~TRINITY_DN9335_c0_g3_i1.p1  ORF type:complete len:152 (+),score=3.58 TRINITY_DN9335_c0_g3_i1:341-796(+)